MIDHSFTCGYGQGVALTCSCGGVFPTGPVKRADAPLGTPASDIAKLLADHTAWGGEDEFDHCECGWTPTTDEPFADHRAHVAVVLAPWRRPCRGRWAARRSASAAAVSRTSVSRRENGIVSAQRWLEARAENIDRRQA